MACAWFPSLTARAGQRGQAHWARGEPYPGTVVDDIACPSCGMWVLTGQLERHKTKYHSQGEPARALGRVPCPECGRLIEAEWLCKHRARYHKSPRTTLTPEPLMGEERARDPIPKAVRIEVWERDEGRCRKCGITDHDAMLRDGEHLQYDHIRPWSLNGADTVNNIQLLCGRCNRAKAARLPGET